MIDRASQIQIAIWNAEIIRARREYEQHPNSGVDWCIKCVLPAGTYPRHCSACRHTLHERRRRSEKKEVA